MKLMSGFALGALFGLALGLFIGSCVVLYLREGMLFGLPQNFVENMVPALFAAIATFLASIFAILGVTLNIMNQNHLAQEDRRLKLLSARASLSAALDDLTRICKLHLLMISRKGDYEIDESMELSERTMSTMKQIIENSAYNVQDNISDLLNFYQVAKARYKSLYATYKNNPERSDSSLTAHHEKHVAVLWASLRALVSCYYNYGRGDSFSIDRSNALQLFKDELIFFGQSDKIFSMSDNIGDSLFSEYIEKEDYIGCGFLDPDYWEKGGLKKEGK